MWQTTGFVQSLLTLSGLAHSVRYVAGNAVWMCKWHIASVRWTELAFRFRGHQIPWRRRMEVQKAWRGASASMAQAVHTGIDAQMLQVRTVCVNSHNFSDAAIAA